MSTMELYPGYFPSMKLTGSGLGMDANLRCLMGALPFLRIIMGFHPSSGNSVAVSEERRAQLGQLKRLKNNKTTTCDLRLFHPSKYWNRSNLKSMTISGTIAERSVRQRNCPKSVP
ncbi:hypothetical protein TNCV_1620601 [Trichonephila clavipes]|nr:hypothetical protein TNCV_1620601 [Trichonephila clavipes]